MGSHRGHSSVSAIPALTPSEVGARFSDPGGMQGWVDPVGWLHTEIVGLYPLEDGRVTHPGTNRPDVG